MIGANVESGNLGLSSLTVATVSGLRRILPNLVVRQQSTSGGSEVRIPVTGGDVLVPSLGFHHSERLSDRSGTRHLAALSLASRVLPRPLRQRLVASNATLSALLDAHAILDFSGGDSFSDLYGPQRFEAHARPKELLLQMGRRLVLMPQSFGPFAASSSRARARRIIAKCALAATRDSSGMEELAALFRGDPPVRVVCCPDLAFCLDPAPVTPLPEGMARSQGGEILVGINVSGLLWTEPERFGLAVDYRHLILRIVQWALSWPEVRVVLVPHVYGSPWSRSTTDVAAGREVYASIAGDDRKRVAALQTVFGAGQMRYLLSQLDFFIGARMHACINAVGESVPTVALAYSHKVAGVFGAIGAPELAVDLRSGDEEKCLAIIAERFLRREQLKAELRERIVAAKRQVDHFLRHELREAILAVSPHEGAASTDQ